METDTFSREILQCYLSLRGFFSYQIGILDLALLSGFRYLLLMILLRTYA